MGFWDGYWKSLKPLEVEETIDVWVHRPLAYLLARAAYSTPVTPNGITLCSIVLGVFSGVCLFVNFPFHLQVSGSALFLSAVFDCADGQLARMRGTSSVLGRMLDGAADLVVSSAVVAGGTYLVWSKFREPWWLGVLVLGLSVTTIVTGSFHTAMYDRYKNVFLRFTHASFREGEDYESALERYRALRGTGSVWTRLVWPVYLFYVQSQSQYIHRFDACAARRFSELPAFDPDRAAIYRAHCAELMRLWRGLFGFGSLVFGMSLTIALEVVEYYLLFRLVVLNVLFYGYMRPKQRRASEAAFRAMGIAAAPPV